MLDEDNRGSTAKGRRLASAILLCCCSLLSPSLSFAAVPQAINFQGKLADAGGTPLTGTYSFRFKLYDAPTGGNLLFTESRTGATALSVVNGIYSVQIGSTVAGGIPASVFDGDNVYLELDVSAGSTLASAETLSPRERLIAVPYSLHSLSAERLSAGSSVSTYTAAGDLILAASLQASSMTLRGADGSGVSLRTAGDVQVGGATASTLSAAGYLTLAGLSSTPFGSRGRIFFDSNGTGALKVSLDGVGFVPIATGTIGGQASVTSDSLQFSGQGTTLSPLALLSSSVTLRGNTFNSADRLLLLDGAGRYPALDGSQVQNLNAASLGAGTVPLARLSGIGSAELADAGILGQDIAASTITLNKLNQSGCALNEVIKWNGTTFVCGVGVVAETDPEVGSTASGRVPRWNGTALVDGTLVDDATNVGVGTASPATKLDVEGAAQFGAGASKSTFTAAGALQLASPLAAGHGGTGLGAAGAAGNVLVSNGANWTSAAISGDASVSGAGLLTIQAASVDTGKLNADSVDGTKLLTGAVQTAKLANDAVTFPKIAQNGCTNGQIIKWNGSAWACASDDSAVANFTVDSDKLATAAVKAEKLAAGAVETAKLAADAVTGAALLNGAVTAAKLGAGAVETAKLAADAVTFPKIAQNGCTNGQIIKWNGSAWACAADDGLVANFSIDSDKLATAAVKAEKLAAGAVETAKLIDGAVQTAKLAVDAVTTAAILDRTVTDSKLALTGVGAGTYGSASQVAQVTVDAQGRITSVANVAVSVGGTDTTKVLKAGDTMTGTLTLSPASGNALVTTAGDVGIGATPVAKLDVAGGSIRALSQNPVVNPGSGKGVELYFDGAADRGRVLSTERGVAAKPLFVDGSATVLQANVSGNVGIGAGAATPLAKLDVTGGAIRALSYSGGPSVPSDGTGVEISYEGTNDRGLIRSFDRTGVSVKALYLDGGPTILNSITGGSVGINTTAPATKLDVAGNAQFGSTAKSTFTTAGVLQLASALATAYGGTNVAASGSAGNILASDGATWASVAVSGDASLSGAGALTIQASAVDTGKIKADSVDSAKLLNGAVQTAKLANDAVTFPKIAQNGCTSGQIIKWNGSAWACAGDDNAVANFSIDSDKLATAAVKAEKLAAGAVETAKLAVDAVTGTAILNGAIQTAKLAADAVTFPKIAQNGCASGQIIKWNGSAWACAGDDNAVANFSIDSDKLATAAVKAEKLAAAAVETAKLAADAVTVAAILNGAVTAAKLGAGAVETAKLGADAVTGASILNNTIQAAKLVPLSIDSSRLASGSVDSEKLVLGSIGPSHLADGAVSTSKLGVDAVTEAAILSNAIAGAKLQDLTIGSTKLGAASVDSEKLVLGSIGPSHLVDGAVSTTKLNTDAVTAVKIADGAVTAAKLYNGDYVRLQGSTPGTQQAGNLHIDGAIIGSGKLVAGGMTAATGSGALDLTVTGSAFFGTGGSYKVTNAGAATLAASSVGDLTKNNVDWFFVKTAGVGKFWWRNSTPTDLMSLDNTGALKLAGTLACQSCAPDIAENISASDASIEPGDVVAVDPAAAERIVKASRPYDPMILGVISPKPGILMNGQFEMSSGKAEDPANRPLVLAGRVPVKVTLEGGPIRKGDYLTSGSRPGYAMRAALAGNTVGIALDDFTGEDGKQEGMVLCFVHIGERNNASKLQELESENRSMRERLDRVEGILDGRQPGPSRW